jgi:hypothetical protein
MMVTKARSGENTSLFKHEPQLFKRRDLVCVEGRLSHTEKLPSATFKLPLALHIGLVTVSAVPIVSIALHSQPRLPALDHEINTLSRNFMLGKHIKITAKKFQGNVNLEPAFEWRRGIHDVPIIL